MPDVAQPFMDDYHAFRSGFGYQALQSRTRIAITGTDCAQVVNNLSTNDINRLEPGQGCEAFITNLQGKTIGHVFVYRHRDRVVLHTVAGQAESLMQHLDRYIIREDAHVSDQSASFNSILLGGKDAERWLRGSVDSLPEAPMRHIEACVDGIESEICRFPAAGPNGIVLNIASQQHNLMIEQLDQVGAKSCQRECIESIRLESGVPEFGHDFSEQNLPQEINRDKQCISFTKGCYLGQETIARIDALGHVNRLLVGLHCESGGVPDVGSPVRQSDQDVGSVTSSCFSPALNAPLAFSMVRRGCHEPGKELMLADGPARVIQLPVLLGSD